MKLNFTKMQGLGNDFVVLDGVRQVFSLTASQIRALADRHFGVGCDQLLLVEPATQPETDFRYRIFNADGGEVEQCGNGARCFVRFVHDEGLTQKNEIRVETAGGIIVLRLEADGLVTVNMGLPVFEPVLVPFQAEQPALAYSLLLSNEEQVIVGVVSMGNPHAVQIVPEVNAAPVERQGPLIEQHARFPQRVNAGFMEIVDRQNIRLRVYERGAGETLACGTGACAAVVTGIRQGLLDERVTASTRGGDLTIAWAGEGSPVMMTGPAVCVFKGEIEI